MKTVWYVRDKEYFCQCSRLERALDVADRRENEDDFLGVLTVTEETYMGERLLSSIVVYTTGG